jgi:O-antigen ligase
VWLLFLAVTGVTALWSVAPQLTELAFRNLALLVVLYVLVALTPVSLPELRRVETALVVGGVLASTYGIFQFVTGTLPVDPESGGGGRFGRDLLGANNTAAALMVPLAIAVCRSASAPRWRVRSAHIAAVAVVLFGVLLTGSRGGLLSTGALLLVAIVYVERNRAFLVRAVLLMVVAAGLVLILQPAGIAGRTDSTSSSGRAEIWKVGLHACETYCVRGSGWGTFPRVYELTQPEVPEARTLERGVAYEPHNIWLLIGIETGVAGFALAVIGLLLTLRDCHRLPNYLRGPPLAGMVATLVAAFFLSNFEYKFFWMTLTYVLMCRSVALTRRTVPSAKLRSVVPEPMPVPAVPTS